MEESKKVQELNEKIHLYEAVFHNILNGVLITDPEGRVIFFSDTYGKFLGMDPKSKVSESNFILAFEALSTLISGGW